MARSKHTSVKIPHPVADAIEEQLRNGTIRYPSRSSAIIGLLRYQALYGGPHWITEDFARMSQEDQDTIDDFCEALNKRGLAMGGSFLRRVAERVAGGHPEPEAHDIPRRSAREILNLARRVANGDQTVWDELR